MNQLIQNLMLPKKGFVFILSALLSLSIISCGSDDGNGVGPDPDPDPGETTTLADLLQDDEELSVLSQLVQDNNLEIDLQGTTAFTIFAPTDSVLNAQDLSGLSDEQLQSIISYHIVPGNLPADQIIDTEQAIASLQEDSIYVSNRTGETEINNKALIQGSQTADNGVVHKIDRLLLPDGSHDVYEIVDKRYYSHQFACSCTAGRSGLVGMLKNADREFTLFVPSDQAFENLEEEIGNLDDVSDEDLREILEYHIVDGKLLAGDLSDGQMLSTLNGAEIMVSTGTDGAVTLNGNASVEVANLEGTNGVVHIIDAVMDASEDGEEQM